MNPNFNPTHSTNDIWRNLDAGRCLTDDLDSIDSSISSLQTGKADSSHTHEQYADSDHTHNQFDISGLADALTGKAASSHSHEQTDIIGLSSVLSGKASSSHTHAQADITGIESALQAKADLKNGKIPSSQLPSYVDDVLECTATSAFPETGEAGKIYVATDTNKTYRWSGSGYVEISSGIALGETSATAYRGDRGKTAYDHSQNSAVHVTTAQKNAWDSKAESDHTHTPASIGAAASVHTHSYNDLDDKPTIPGEYSHPASHPASMIIQDNTHRFVTDDEKTEWNDKAAGDHTHSPASIGASATGHTHSFDDLDDKPTIPPAYTHPSSHPIDMITGLVGLLATDTAGNVKISLTSGNILATIGTKDKGLYTFYSAGGVNGNPNTTESWRGFVHKTGVDFGWVIAFGSYGSVYTNYLDNGTWRGWRAIYDANPAPLWAPSDGTGGYYMTDGHTVTPSKKLSECRNGWLLMWSNYNTDSSATGDYDWHCSMIPKIRPSGDKWTGHSWIFDIPAGMQNVSPYTTETREMKWLYVYDNKLVGHAANNQNGRNDIVLRAVYEF